MALEKQRKTFLSYSRVNKDFAVKLAKELKSEGFDVWLDQLDIPLGARWDREVERALKESEIFMIILTASSVDSENVLDEIGYAIDNSKRFLPVLLEPCEVPLRLRRFQYVDFTNKDFDDGVESAKDLLRALIAQITIPRQAAADQQEGIVRKAKEEAERKAKEEADHLAAQKAEADRKAKEKADRLATQKAEDDRIAKAKAVSNSVMPFDLTAIAKEAERQAAKKAEADKLAKQKAEDERIAKAKAETERKAKEEADLKAKVETDRKAREENERITKIETDRKAKEEAERKSRSEERLAPAPSPVPRKKSVSKGFVAGIVALVVFCFAGLGLAINAFSNGDTQVANASGVSQSATKQSTVSAPQPTNTPRATDTPPPTLTPIPFPIVLNASDAGKILEGGNWKGIFATASEQHTDDEIISYFDNSQSIPVTLTNLGPIVVGYSGICATTKDILSENIKYTKLKVVFSDESVPESKFFTDYYTADDGWECISKRIVIDDWTTGEYTLYHEISVTKTINDGESDYDPYTEGVNYIITVP